MRPLILLTTLALSVPLPGLGQTAGPPDAAAAGNTAATPAADAAPWLTSLQTDTPQQGFELALGMARHAVKATQPDVAVLKEQRPAYSTDAGSLIDVSGVAAAWFATVAAANDYWRK